MLIVAWWASSKLMPIWFLSRSAIAERCIVGIMDKLTQQSVERNWFLVSFSAGGSAGTEGGWEQIPATVSWAAKRGNHILAIHSFVLY